MDYQNILLSISQTNSVENVLSNLIFDKTYHIMVYPNSINIKNDIVDYQHHKVQMPQ